MKNIITGLLIFTLITLQGCSKEVILEESCTMTAIINGSNWCGQIFQIYIDTEGQLVINGDKKNPRPGIDSEQIVMIVKDFDGTGHYPLGASQAIYREWFAEDQILTLASVSSEDAEASFVVIDSYDALSGSIGGSFEFEATGESKIIVKEGKFEGSIE